MTSTWKLVGGRRRASAMGSFSSRCRAEACLTVGRSPKAISGFIRLAITPMYSKKFIAGAAVAVALLPTLALGQSTDTQAKIQSLLSQIQELQRQVMVLISSAGVFKPIGTEGTGIVSGKITAVNDSSITVQNREGTKSTIVNYTASTTIEVFNASSTPQWQTGSATDLTVGKGVAVQGTKATENAVDATRIKVGILLTGQERLVNVPPGQVSKALCISLDRNLGPGSRGEDVRQLQEML